MAVVRLTLSQTTVDELSEKLEVALTPVPLTLEERIAALEARKFRPLRTGPNAELITSIAATAGSPYDYFVLYSLPLPDIQAGDLIEALCMFQVSVTETDASNTVRYMVGKWLTVADSPTSTDGIRLVSPTTMNVQRLRVHEPIPFFGEVTVDQDMSGKYLNAVVYSQRLVDPFYSAAGPGTIRVDMGYGHMSGKIWPASMLA